MRWPRTILPCLVALLIPAATPGEEGPGQVLEAGPGGVLVRYEVGTARVEEADSLARVRLSLPGWGGLSETGAPDLPATRFLVALPPGTRPSLSWHASGERLMPGLIPLPVPGYGDPLDSRAEQEAPAAVRRDGQAYQRSEPFPPAPAWVEWTGSLGGVPVASVRVAPLAYRPGEGISRLDSIRVIVQFVEDPAGGAVWPEAGRLSSVLHSIVQGAVLNPELLDPLPPGVTPPDPTPQGELDGSPGLVKIFVEQDGLYRLTHADLAGAGADLTGVDPATLRLEEGGEEVAIIMEDGADGSFDPGDRLLFIGRAATGIYTRRNVYWLDWGGSPGLRMSVRDVSPAGGVPVVTTYTDLLRREVNAVYWQNMPYDLDMERWFEKKTFLGESHDYDFSLAYHDDTASDARLRVRLMGRTDTASDPDHHTRVLLNGAQVDDQMWEGQVPFIHDVTVAAGLLQEGTNSVTIVQPGGADPNLDSIFFDWLELDYRDRLVAEGDHLRFTVSTAAQGHSEVRIDGFTTATVSVFDLSDPRVPERLTGLVFEGDGSGGQRVRFDQADFSERPYLALADALALSPAGVETDTPSNLLDPPGGADLLIVSHADFLPAAERLADHRSLSEGLRVVVAEIQDVYDEFSFGLYHPPAISDLVAHALTSWTAPAPTFLILLGDANQDWLDNYLTGNPDWIPTRTVYTSQVGETPTDNLYAAVLGTDPLPDIVVGRLSARTLADADAMVDKTVANEAAPPEGLIRTQSLFVADDDEQAFEDLLDDLAANHLPTGHAARKVYLADYGSTNDATNDIIARVDEGALTTTYMGHGAKLFWGQEKIFEVADVPSLSNGVKQTFAVMLNCINGYYALTFDPYSHAEEWARWPDRGAVFLWAPTGYGFSPDYRKLSDRLFEQVFDLGEDRAGVAAHNAKILAVMNDAANEEALQVMTFFGDPAGRLALDRDGDGLLDREEAAYGGDALDGDSDEDGLADGDETDPGGDADGDGTPNIADADADDDGVADGTEAGRSSAGPDTDPDGPFVPDADPGTTTDPRVADTDGGGSPDGAEDRSGDGEVDAGETDPELASDDPACPAGRPPEVDPVPLSGLRLGLSGDDIVVSWTPLEGQPCALYRILVSTDSVSKGDGETFRPLAITGASTWDHRGAAVDGALHDYLVVATTLQGGDGPTGHHGDL